MSIALLVFCAALPDSMYAAADGDSKPLWVVVGREPFIDELQPLIDKRRQEGFETIVSTATVRRALTAAPRRPDYLLLIGDYEKGQKKQPWYLATKRRKLYRWREVQAKSFVSDTAWGDVDRDLIPDMAVGRIPARSPRDVKIVVDKILEFERREPTLSDLQLLVWSGSAFYGPTIDKMASGLILPSIQNGGPKWLRPWIMIGDNTQPFCGWPPDQPSRFSRKMREGGICHVFIGHGNERHFISMLHKKKQISYSIATARNELAEGSPTPPMILLACQSGNFAYSRRCMAESFLFLEGGPVVTIGATTESHPLPNYFSGQSLLWAIGEKDKRIGDVWLKSQKRAMKARDFVMEQLLKNVEGKLEEEINVQKLRRDQMLMYALLGDPATRLRLPEPLEATVERKEDGWYWTVQRPKAATRLQVGFRASRQKRPSPSSGEDRAEANSVLERANAGLGFEPLALPDNTWSGTIEHPGLVRFVATGGGKIYATTLDLQESTR